MFTGLIKHLGKVARRTDRSIAVECPSLIADIQIGDSISVSGACLTAAKLTSTGFEADLLPETAANTILGTLKPGAKVNLEPALAAGERFGGHFVQGHVDGTAVCTKVERRNDGSVIISFEATDWLKPWLVAKCSIAIDGVSLTLQDLSESEFSVSIIPVTRKDTTLGNIMSGSRVNIEADMMVKTIRSTVDSLIGDKQSLDSNTLKNYGYGE